MSDGVLEFLWSLEAVMLVIHLIVTAVYEFVIITKRVLHPNIQLLLAFNPIPIIIFQSSLYFGMYCDLYLVISSVAEDTLDFVMDTAHFAGGFNVFSLMVERVFATVLVDKYEKIHFGFPIIGAIIASVQIASCIGIMFMRYSKIISIYVVFGLVTAAIILALITFLILPKVSKQIYKEALEREGRFGESLQRYQALENCRSAKILKRFVILHVSLSPIAIIGYFYIKTSHAQSSTIMFRSITSLYHSYVSLMGIASCCVILSSHNTFKKNALRPLPRICRRGNSVRDNEVIINMNGRNLNLSVEEQRAAYDNYYSNNW